MTYEVNQKQTKKYRVVDTTLLISDVTIYSYITAIHQKKNIIIVMHSVHICHEISFDLYMASNVDST